MLGYMDIKTRFKPGDSVWIMHMNKPKNKVVASIRCQFYRTYSNINYIFETNSTVISKTETEVYATKQELLEAL